MNAKEQKRLAECVRRVSVVFALIASLSLNLSPSVAGQIESETWDAAVYLRIGAFAQSPGIYRVTPTGNWVGVAPAAAAGVGFLVTTPVSWLDLKLGVDRTLDADLEERPVPGNTFHGHGPDPVTLTAGSLAAVLRPGSPQAMLRPYVAMGATVKRFVGEAADVRASPFWRGGFLIGLGMEGQLWGLSLGLEASDHVSGHRRFRGTPVALPVELYPDPPVTWRHDVFLGLTVRMVRWN